jgi:DNA-binding NtrC family response regulator
MSKRILVVDDDPRVLFVFRGALSKLDGDYEIETARGGDEALEKAAAGPFDLVITDLNMPGLDGLRLTESLGALSPLTVVVWMTACGCRSLAREARRLRVHRCLDKPVEINEIRQVARDALKNSNRGSTRSESRSHTELES